MRNTVRSGISTAILCRQSEAPATSGGRPISYSATVTARLATEELTDFVAAVLRRRGYDVRINEIFKGVEIVKRQGRPAARRHSLQIEVDRALYMDQKTLQETRTSHSFGAISLT